jgi:hypothetical protein
MIAVIGIFIALANLQNALTDQVGQRMFDV